MPTDTSKPKPPRTESQREAARRNGAKSKGPITAEGKQTSALNSTRHGLRAEKTFVLENESVADFEDFRETIVQRFQPADKLELDLCLEMAHARWRLHRAWTIETAMLDVRMVEDHDRLLVFFENVDENTRLSEAWSYLARNGQALSLLHRYEARLRRIFERALQNLQQLQRQRQNEKPPPEKAPSEPEQPAIPVQNQPKPQSPPVEIATDSGATFRLRRASARLLGVRTNTGRRTRRRTHRQTWQLLSHPGVQLMLRR